MGLYYDHNLPNDAHAFSRYLHEFRRSCRCCLYAQRRLGWWWAKSGIYKAEGIPDACFYCSGDLSEE